MSLISRLGVTNATARDIPEGRRQYQTLDGLRGVAALSVVILHTPHFFNKWHLAYSYLAVDLFFILSGFVLAAAYEPKFRAGMTVATFFRIRWIRLYPLYLLGTLAGIPVALLAMKYGGIGVEWSPHMLVTSLPFSILMLPMPAVGSDGLLYPFNPPIWSIFFEIFANVLYALLVNFLVDTKKLVVLVVMLAFVFAANVLHADLSDGGYSWFTFSGGISRALFGFFCGVLIYRFRPSVRINSSLFALGLLIAFLILEGVNHTGLTIVATVLFLFPVMVLLAASVEPGSSLQQAFGLLGVTSYAVYALHKPIYQLLLGFLIVVSPVRPESMAPWIGVAYLGLIFVACVLVDRFYDVPVRQFLGGLRRRELKSSNSVG